MMHNLRGEIGMLAAGIIALCALEAAAEIPGPYEPPMRNETSAAVSTPETVIMSWPGPSRAEARVLIAKYGEPSVFDDDSLVWYGNSPWRKTVVHREAPRISGDPRGQDVLEQSIAYQVPENKAAALKRFDGRIASDRTSEELSSRAKNESLNFLALNLADEVITDRRSADDARAFLRRTMKLAEAGKSSPYMDGFIFSPSDRKAPARDSRGEPSPTAAPYQGVMPDRVLIPPYP